MRRAVPEPSLGPCGGLIATPVQNSRDQEFVVVPIVDDIALYDDRPNAFTELRPVPADAGLFAKQLESIKDGVNESIGNRGTGILGNVGPDLLEVLLGKSRQPIVHYGFLPRAARPRDLICPASCRPELRS